MQPFRIIALSLCFLGISTAQGYAETRTSEPITLRPFKNEDVGKYHDSYQRQIKYLKESQKFRAMIEERQKLFVAPQVKAERNYDKELQNLYRSYSDSSD